MFSSESLSLARTKIKGGSRTYGSEAEEDKRGSDGNVARGFAISQSNPFGFRCWKDGEFPGIGEVKDELDGDVVLTDDDNLSAIFASYLPLSAPVAMMGLPKALGGNVVIAPRVFAVDMYVTVDGEAKTDGHICCGDASLDRTASIQHCYDKVAHQDEDVKGMLTDGPASGGKPWATLVASEFETEAYVHLPLIWQGDLDDATFPASETYGGSLLGHFSELLS